MYELLLRIREISPVVASSRDPLKWARTLGRRERYSSYAAGLQADARASVASAVHLRGKDGPHASIEPLFHKSKKGLPLQHLQNRLNLLAGTVWDRRDGALR